MKKFVAALVLAGAAATALSGTASAAAPQFVGPFRTMSDCKSAEKDAKKQGHKIVNKCAKARSGFFFSFR